MPEASLERAFKLLDKFPSQTPKEKRLAIAEVEDLLRTARAKGRQATLALRTVDQLQKQRAYMLIESGRVNEGIRAIQELVAGKEGAIAELHEEAAFQLAEGAIAAFRRGQAPSGRGLARSALRHAGASQRISKTVLAAIELLQSAQGEESRKAQGRT